MSGGNQSVRRALGGPAFPAVPGFRRLPAYLASGPHITWPLSSASSSEDLVTTAGSPRESKTIPPPRPRSGPLTEPHLQSPLKEGYICLGDLAVQKRTALGPGFGQPHLASCDSMTRECLSRPPQRGLAPVSPSWARSPLWFAPLCPR